MTRFDCMHSPELIQTHAIFKTPTVFRTMGAEYITQLPHA